MAIPSFHSEHVAKKIIYILHHLSANDSMGYKLWCSLGYLKLEVGINDNISATCFNDMGFLATASLVPNVWKEASSLSLTIRGTNDLLWIPKTQHTNNCFLMDIATCHFTHKQLLQNNMCCPFLNVLTISDITTHDCTQIHPHYYHGTNGTGRWSNYKWPNKRYPPKSYWCMWRKFLTHSLRYPNLTQPLTSWTPCAQYSQQLDFHLHEESGDLNYQDTTSSWHCHAHISQRTLQCISPFSPTPSTLPPPWPPNSCWCQHWMQYDNIAVYLHPMHIAAQKYHQHWAQSQQAHPFTLTDHYNALPLPLKWVCGKVVIPNDGGSSLAKAARVGMLLGASDGSVMGDNTTQAWILTSGVDDQAPIYCMAGAP